MMGDTSNTRTATSQPPTSRMNRRMDSGRSGRLPKTRFSQGRWADTRSSVMAALMPRLPKADTRRFDSSCVESLRLEVPTDRGDVAAELGRADGVQRARARQVDVDDVGDAAGARRH